MPENNVQHGKSFEENLEILHDEIVLAEQWGRPSLLLAVQKSKIGQDKAEKALEARLAKGGFRVERIVMNEGRFDIAQLMREAGPRPKLVFYISNIGWGGGEEGRQAYRALNLHRELFVDEAVKAVFWLTENEAVNLPRFAPDFWAFRHRVVEFVSQRAAGKVHLPAGILAWDIQQSPDPFEQAESGIQAREELLRKLPEGMEAISTRVELHASIGYLHWTLGDLGAARDAFLTGLALAKSYELPELKASLLNGLGVVSYEGGERVEAAQRFEEGLHFRALSRVLLINLSATNSMLGRVQEALTQGKKAIRANPSDADTWMRLGYIEQAVGRMDDAFSSVSKAVELSPRSARYEIALAVLYSLVEQPEETRIHLGRGRELASGSESIYASILGEAALGEASKARALLSRAISSGKIKRHEARRDLNLGLVMEPADLEAALAGPETGRPTVAHV